MRLGLVINNHGAHATEIIERMSRRAEELGYDSLWVTDHVVGVRSFEPVYGAAWMEPLTSLAWIAAVTKRIRLGVGVLVAPYRDPVLAAKMITTIDRLSDGRVDLGVGTGWSGAEYDALGRGALFDERGAVTNESLDLMLRCWQGGEFDWQGRFFRFRKIRFEPVPCQRPRIPLWIGSRTARRAPMERVARYADVWHPTGLLPDELRRAGDELDDLAGRRIRRTVRLSRGRISSTGEWIDLLGAYREVGVDEAAIDFGGLDAELAEPGAVDRILDSAESLIGRRCELD